jgi:KDO2-lipid IV(A) lauroyltransferase
VLVLSTMAALVGCVPFGDLGVLAAPLAWLAGAVVRVRRGHVEASMARAGLQGVGARASAMYTSLATGVMELLWLAGASRRDLATVVTLDPGSRALLEEALDPGHGAVFAASHTGNWELAACAVAQRRPLSVVVKRVSLGAFDRFIRRLRTRYSVGLLEGEDAFGRAWRELRAARLVAVLIDQVPPREEHAEWLPFLGAEALVDRAPAALASSAGVPLVVTASRRDEHGRHVLHVLSVKWPPFRERRAWVLEATRETTRELAAFVARYPEQWLWLHRRWRPPATAGGRRSLVTRPPRG